MYVVPPQILLSVRRVATKIADYSGAVIEINGALLKVWAEDILMPQALPNVMLRALVVHNLMTSEHMIIEMFVIYLVVR